MDCEEVGSREKVSERGYQFHVVGGGYGLGGVGVHGRYVHAEPNRQTGDSDADYFALVDGGPSYGGVVMATSTKSYNAKSFAFDFYTNKSTSFPFSSLETGGGIGHVPSDGEDQGDCMFCSSLKWSGYR